MSVCGTMLVFDSGVSSMESDAPSRTYLGRPMEEWMADLLDADVPADAALPYKAIPCFGAAIIPTVMAELARTVEWKQVCLVNCIAETGLTGIPALLELTTHRSDTIRAAACDGVAEAMDSGLDSTSFVADTFAEVIRALEGLRYEDVVVAFDRLATAMEESDSLTVADDEVLAALMARLDDPVPAVRISAIEAIRRVKHGEHQAGRIFSMAVLVLADKDPEVRQAAAAYLRQASPHEIMPSSEDIGRLRRALADSSRFVRKTAARLLRTLPGGPHAPDKLLRPSDREPDEPTPEQVVEMINRALAPPTVPPPPEPIRSLGELLQNLWSPSVVTRVAALESLKKGQKDMAQAEDAILAALCDSDIAVRIAAVTAIDAIGSATANVAWNLHAALADYCLQVAKKARSVLGDTLLKMSEVFQQGVAEND